MTEFETDDAIALFIWLVTKSNSIQGRYRFVVIHFDSWKIQESGLFQG